jgi:catechol 2,3-dioxygenase-like lactoylglutathione lyase family enzyme
MSSTDATTGTPVPKAGEIWLEVVPLPVSDIDRSKRFFEGLGWRLDADLKIGEDGRVVQFTPPGSACSISFGTILTNAAPGSAQGLEMAVHDIEAARQELIGHGVEVSDVFHPGENGFEPGPDPERRSYFTYASFSDPDGNTFLLQEIKERLPGR